MPLPSNPSLFGRRASKRLAQGQQGDPLQNAAARAAAYLVIFCIGIDRRPSSNGAVGRSQPSLEGEPTRDALHLHWSEQE